MCGAMSKSFQNSSSHCNFISFSSAYNDFNEGKYTEKGFVTILVIVISVFFKFWVSIKAKYKSGTDNITYFHIEVALIAYNN